MGEMMLDDEELWRLAKAKGLDKDELESLLREANIGIRPPLHSDEQKEKKKKVANVPVQPITAPPKKKRKTEKESTSSLPVFDLVEPEFVSSTTSDSAPMMEDDAYGEVSALEHADAADKTARRKTLRFHTSKIDSSSARRQGARNTAFGGDDDIPYRERKHEREARLAKEAAARGAGKGGDDLDDVEPEPSSAASKKRQREEDEEEEDPAEYYNLVKKKTMDKKAQKKAQYEAEREALRYAFLFML